MRDENGDPILDIYGNPQYTQISNRTKITVTGPNSPTSRVRMVRYDMGMNPVDETDGNGTVLVRYEYNDIQNPTRPTNVWDARDEETQFTYDAYGNLLTTLSTRGILTTFQYDYGLNPPAGRLVSIQQSHQGVSRPATTIEYETNGLVKKVTGPLPGGGTGSIESTYDALGNVLTVTAPGNNATTTRVTTLNYTQDPALGFSQPAALSQPLTVTDNIGTAATPLYRTAHLRYDAQGRLIWSQDPVGNIAEFSYNLVGQLLDSWLPATGQTGSGRRRAAQEYLYMGGSGVKTRFYKESGTLARLLETTLDGEGAPTLITGGPESASFHYFRTGLLGDRKDGNNAVNSYIGYDNRDRPYFVAYPGEDSINFSDLGFRSVSYNNANQITWREDSANDPAVLGPSVSVNYSYNTTGGLLTDIEYPANPGRNVHITYDAYGRVTERTDESGIEQYQWGDADELLSVTTTYKNPAGTGYLPTKTISYTYYPDGSRASMTTPAGMFSYQYDAGGRMVSMTNPYGQTTIYEYLANNWLARQVAANGLETLYTYNAKGQLLSLVNNKLTVSGSSLLCQFVIPAVGGYDGVGNRLSVTSTFSPSFYSPNVPTPLYDGTTSWQYDAKGRLIQEQWSGPYPYTHTYGYDNAGNLTNFKGQARQYRVGANQRKGTGFVYDVQGNPTKYVKAISNGSVNYTHTFDEESRLLQSSYVWGGNTYISLQACYRSDGLRARKQGSPTSPVIYFLYDGVIPVVELDASGNLRAVNTFGASGLVSRWKVVTDEHGGRAGHTFYGFDERGNMAIRLDESCNKLTLRRSEAFGLQGVESGTNGDPFSGMGARYGYYREPGQSDFYLCTYRYYDVRAGRWLTRDPIGYAGGVNLYAYCQNNPIMGKDALGLADPPLSQTPSAVKDMFLKLPKSIQYGVIGMGGSGTIGLGGALLCEFNQPDTIAYDIGTILSGGSMITGGASLVLIAAASGPATLVGGLIFLAAFISGITQVCYGSAKMIEGSVKLSGKLQPKPPPRLTVTPTSIDFDVSSPPVLPNTLPLSSFIR